MTNLLLSATYVEVICSYMQQYVDTAGYSDRVILCFPTLSAEKSGKDGARKSTAKAKMLKLAEWKKLTPRIVSLKFMAQVKPSNAGPLTRTLAQDDSHLYCEIQIQEPGFSFNLSCGDFAKKEEERTQPIYSQRSFFRRRNRCFFNEPSISRHATRRMDGPHPVKRSGFDATALSRKRRGARPWRASGQASRVG